MGLSTSSSYCCVSLLAIDQLSFPLLTTDTNYYVYYLLLTRLLATVHLSFRAPRQVVVVDEGVRGVDEAPDARNISAESGVLRSDEAATHCTNDLRVVGGHFLPMEWGKMHDTIPTISPPPPS